MRSFVFSLLLIGSAAQAQSVHGLMMVVKGKVKVEKGGKSTPAKVGMKVFPQDTIVAEKDSRAKIVMSDKNEINISPETRLNLESYVFNPQKNEKNVILNVVYGKVRSTVNQKYDGEKNKFHVKTPSAVAGVRGTDFLASFDPASKLSKVITFSGVVEVGTPGAGGSIANAVRVEPGQFTTTSGSAPPAPPAAVPAAELKQVSQESRPDTPPVEAPKAQEAKPQAEAKPEAKSDAKTAGKPDTKMREPAQAGGPGSMIEKRDLGPAVTSGDAMPDFSRHGGDIREIAPVLSPTAGLPPKCEFCDRQISNGPTLLNIQINVQ